MRQYFCKCGSKYFVLGVLFYENNAETRNDKWYQKGFFKRPPFYSATYIDQRGGMAWVPIIQVYVCGKCGKEAAVNDLILREGD